jgi:parallel beta-helix repeat protein
MSALVTVLAIRAPARAQVVLSAGDNIQNAVNSNPAGTVFVLNPGVYRMQDVTPKSNDTFIGVTPAALNGSTVVTGWTASGSYWLTSGYALTSTTYQAETPGSGCNDASTGCDYPQDLFLDSTPLVHKLSLPISSGQWYVDYAAGTIYIADNPTGHTMELSESANAFAAGPSVDNVTITNLIISKYAVTLQDGAIAPQGSGWVIMNNQLKYNHGAGIKPRLGNNDFNEQIVNNNAHDNGQEGIGCGGCNGSLIKYNTSSHNNYANVLDGFEEGGGKFTGTNIQILNNTYTNNNGEGLWIDGGASNITIVGNTLTNNRLSGLRYELSHGGLIQNNSVQYNDQWNGSCQGGNDEIAIASSDTTTVTYNTIVSSCAGIGMTSSAKRSPIATHNHVTYNATSYLGSGRMPEPTGATDSCDESPTSDQPAADNYYDYNAYHFTLAAQLDNLNWQWRCSTKMVWAQWQAAGEDIHGTVDANVSAGAGQ